MKKVDKGPRVKVFTKLQALTNSHIFLPLVILFLLGIKFAPSCLPCRNILNFSDACFSTSKTKQCCQALKYPKYQVDRCKSHNDKLFVDQIYGNGQSDTNQAENKLENQTGSYKVRKAYIGVSFLAKNIIYREYHGRLEPENKVAACRSNQQRLKSVLLNPKR